MRKYINLWATAKSWMARVVERKRIIDKHLHRTKVNDTRIFVQKVETGSTVDPRPRSWPEQKRNAAEAKYSKRIVTQRHGLNTKMETKNSAPNRILVTVRLWENKIVVVRYSSKYSNMKMVIWLAESSRMTLYTYRWTHSWSGRTMKNVNISAGNEGLCVREGGEWERAKETAKYCT